MQAASTFEALGLPPAILKGLTALGFVHPTPVQEAAIPEVLLGKDLMVQAKTGSGKTLAFGLPLLARLDPQSPDTQVLIITPTRELAIQVAEELNKVGGHMGILVAAIYGGTKMDSQMTDLAWASIIVGTPGRLRDHLTRGNLHLEKCTTVVLDEADEMLDMGFKDDLEFILDGLPKPRVTLLFSATFPKAIETIARKYMRDAQKIAVSSGLVTPTDIAHRVLNTTEAHRIDALTTMLKQEDATLCLVFCKRKSETSAVARKLRAANIAAGYLNGDMNQAQRIATLDQFKRGEINVLVATDVAARGLDIQNISHVFNVSVPMDTETYVHRSGRTGRAGRKGTCVTLVTPEEARSFARIQQDLAESMRKATLAEGGSRPAAAPSGERTRAPRREAEPLAEPTQRTEPVRTSRRREEPVEPVRSRRREETSEPERSRRREVTSEPEPSRRREVTSEPERSSRRRSEPAEPERGSRRRPEALEPERSPRPDYWPEPEPRAPREDGRRRSEATRETTREDGRRRGEPTREAARGMKADPEEIFRASSGREDRFRELARELLARADQEKLVASLLSLSGTGRKMLEERTKAERPKQDESREPQEARRRDRAVRVRTTRKPSSVVYGE